MSVAGARDVAGASRSGAGTTQFGRHCRQHRGVLPHAEVIVRAPHRDLGADAMIEGAREIAATPLQIGKDAVAALGMQRIHAGLEEIVEVHLFAATPEEVNDSTLSKYRH